MEAGGVLFPEIGADGGGWGWGLIGEEGEGADGEEIGKDGGEGLQDKRFELMEGVEDEGAGGAGVLGFVAVIVEHGVVRISGADEAGDVLEADSGHGRNPVDRSLQVAVRQVTLICRDGETSRTRRSEFNFW